MNLTANLTKVLKIPFWIFMEKETKIERKKIKENETKIETEKIKGSATKTKAKETNKKKKKIRLFWTSFLEIIRIKI